MEGQEDVRVICRDVQRDVVKDLPTHLDLMRLRRTSKVNLFIRLSSSTKMKRLRRQKRRHAERDPPRG